MALIFRLDGVFWLLFAQFYETKYIFIVCGFVHLCNCAPLNGKFSVFHLLRFSTHCYQMFTVYFSVSGEIIEFIRMNFQFTFKVLIFVQKNIEEKKGKEKRSLNSIQIIVFFSSANC